MSSFVVLMNTLIIVGMVISGILAVFFDKILSSIIAYTCLGAFLTVAFILLAAPDVAVAEAAVGVVLIPVIFITALKATEGDGEK